MNFTGTNVPSITKFAISATVISAFVFVAGCRTHHYCVPASEVAEYKKTIPFPAGFYMSNELRNTWFKKEKKFSRIDMPLGTIVLNTAKARLKNAFTKTENVDLTSIPSTAGRAFYTTPFKSRRAEAGILIKLKSLDFKTKNNVAECKMTFAVEDKNGKDIFEKQYTATGQEKVGGSVLGVFGSDYKKINKSTEIALCNIFSQLLVDIRKKVVPDS